jgi:hypothetical protein
MGKAQQDERQVTFSFASAPVQIIPQADGSVLVKPGRQILRQWLSSEAIGAEFGRTAQAVCRWRQEGLIPQEYYRFEGRRKIGYRADVIPLLKAYFAKAHGD